MTEPQATLLLQAALDGELDAAGVIEVEAKLAADPALAAEYARLVALQGVIRARLPRDRAPDALRARVIAMAQAPAAASAPRRPFRLMDSRFRAMAASLVLGALLGAGGLQIYTASLGGDDVQQAIVAGYIRGRLNGQPVDVATSDRHTVKPWLAGKVAGSTTVVDLKADGFPLVGGRIDVVGRTPAATLIYQRREHQIALTELPGDGAAKEPRSTTRDGFSLMDWSDGLHRYAVVSDLPPGELREFCRAFRRAADAEREEPAKT
jgi:anti-sigma factor RsiW